MSIKEMESKDADLIIAASVRSRFLADKSIIRELDIQVVAVAGIVTLTGVVPTEEIGERAVFIAKNTNGVIAVVSHLLAQH